MPRLQVKWSHGHIDLKRKRDEYARRLTHGKRRRPTGLEVDLEARVLGARAKPRKELVGFAWRGPQCGVGVLWNCEVCGRAVIAQVGWLQEERLHEVARQVLESLDDHGAGGWEMWGLDGLACLVPEGYALAKWQRMTRYLELRFARGPASLRTARWGMVPLVLGEQTVEEWYRRQLQGRRDVRWQAEEMEIKDHPGVGAWGTRRRLLGGVRTRAARLLRRRPAVNFAACAWHCEESNRLFLVETLEPGEGEVLKGVVDSIVCHRDE